MKTVRMRPHHLLRLCHYTYEYNEGDKKFYRDTDESGGFYDKAFKLFNQILDKSVERIRIVPGIDSVCSLCPERNTYVGDTYVGYPKDCLKSEGSRILKEIGLEMGKEYSPEFVLERLKSYHQRLKKKE